MAPRMLSMWCFLAIACLSTIWLCLDWLSEHGYDPGSGGYKAVLALSVLGMVLRVIAQPSLAEEQDADALAKRLGM